MATLVLLPSCIHRHTFAWRRGPLAREIEREDGADWCISHRMWAASKSNTRSPASCQLRAYLFSFSFTFFFLFRPFFVFLGWRWRFFPRVFHSPSCVLVCACVCRLGAVYHDWHTLGPTRWVSPTVHDLCLVFFSPNPRKTFLPVCFSFRSIFFLCTSASECVYRGLFCILTPGGWRGSTTHFSRHCFVRQMFSRR